MEDTAHTAEEWSELSDAGYSHQDKIEQVLQQLREGRAKVLFDLTSNSWNIASVEEMIRKAGEGKIA